MLCSLCSLSRVKRCHEILSSGIAEEIILRKEQTYLPLRGLRAVRRVYQVVPVAEIVSLADDQSGVLIPREGVSTWLIYQVTH